MLTPERAQLEALLFATDTPVTLQRIAEIMVMSVGRVDRELELLEEHYREQGHSLFIAREGSAIRLRTRPEHGQILVAVRGEPARLSRPALEVLSVVVMQKSATRSEIDRLRGVDSDSVVNGLIARGLIEETGREESPGRAAIFKVTDLFLELFGVTKVTDLQDEYALLQKSLQLEEPPTLDADTASAMEESSTTESPAPDSTTSDD